MFERFTDRARRVVVLAQVEARLLNHNYIGTEHILLGVIHEGEGVAAQALKSLDVSLEQVRVMVEEIIGQGEAAPTGHIPFTPRAKKVLELSLRESLQLGHNYIGTEHILLGLVREGEGVAAQVLVKLGADMNSVRRKVVELLEGYTGERYPEAVKEQRSTGLGTIPRLADETIRALDAARDIATRVGHDKVQPADLLLGLFDSSDLDVAALLQKLDIDLALFKQRLDELQSKGSFGEVAPSSETDEESEAPGSDDRPDEGEETGD
jgi:ATP-dependent Clp protease ATP-binding subunit ClpA